MGVVSSFRLTLPKPRFVVRRDWNFAKSGMAAFFP